MQFTKQVLFMRNFPCCFLIGVLASVGMSFAQSTDITLGSDLPTLVAGGGPQTLNVTSTTLANIPFTITWNGASKNFQVLSSSYPYGTRFAVSLTADDLAMSQLGQLALYDARNNTLIATLVMPVVYPVAAVSTLYDSAHGKLYLTTGAATTYMLSGGATSAADPRFAVNSLIAIDVNTGVITNTLALGAAGGPMALSDDSSTLYVAVAPGIVRKVDPVSFTAMGDFSMPGDNGNRMNIADIAVLPGSASAVMVQYFSPSGTTSATFAIFDAGVQRANILEHTQSAYPYYSSIVFSPDGKYVFLGQPSPWRYEIDSKGFVASSLTKGPGGAPVSIMGDTLFTQSGVSINWHTMLPTGSLGTAQTVAADALNSRLLGIFSSAQYAPYQTILQAFDLTSQVPLGTIQLPLTPVKLIRFGVDGLIAPTRGVIAGGPILLFHTSLAGPAPAVTPNGIVSAASFGAGAIAPGEILSIFGTSLGPTAGEGFTVTGDKVNAPADVQVWFGDRQGTVLFASPGQINVAAPFGLAPGSTVPVQIVNNGIPSARLSYSVAATAPALLTRNASGQGLLAMVNQDGSINSPAPAGSIVSLYGTGGGIYPGAKDNLLSTGISYLNADVHVTIGGQDAKVLYAGAAPSLVTSAFQINVEVPPGMPPGSAVPVVLTIGGQSSSQEVSIEVR